MLHVRRGADQQKPVEVLSGGERNRLCLAQTLKQGGNLLLLDEPTNDLDVDTLRALEDAIDKFAGCAVIISHDRYFLDRVCTHIVRVYLFLWIDMSLTLRQNSFSRPCKYEYTIAGF